MKLGMSRYLTLRLEKTRLESMEKEGNNVMYQYLLEHSQPYTDSLFKTQMMKPSLYTLILKLKNLTLDKD